MNDSSFVYDAATLHLAYRWALFDDLWGDNEKRQRWITKAKEMVQNLWESEYKNLEIDNSEINSPANKRLKISRNRFTAWHTQKRGLAYEGLSVDNSINSPAPSFGSSISDQDLDEYEQWQCDINDSDVLVIDPYEYWHMR